MICVLGRVPKRLRARAPTPVPEASGLSSSTGEIKIPRVAVLSAVPPIAAALTLRTGKAVLSLRLRVGGQRGQCGPGALRSWAWVPAALLSKCDASKLQLGFSPESSETRSAPQNTFQQTRLPSVGRAASQESRKDLDLTWSRPGKPLRMHRLRVTPVTVTGIKSAKSHIL